MQSRLSANERRTQLIIAAMAVAERGGLSSVTVRAIAEEAGVSLGVVHYCFDSKEALLGAMGEVIVTNLSAALRWALGTADKENAQPGQKGLRELLHSGMSAMWPVIEVTPRQQMLTYELTAYALRMHWSGSDADGIAEGVARKQYTMMDQEAIWFLEDAARQTGTVWLEPVESVATFALSLFQGIILRWLVSRDDEMFITQLDDLCGMVALKAGPRPDDYHPILTEPKAKSAS